ncbi:hypothetical protein CTRI78_v006568 [Colletotrichum trifolii]|uniref:Cyanovirin-N domain-containing protein n=1 Tax=Colletotrichum trifolii TaxID=5466 RepID=A0A4R8RC58_COLTR|nr:hypothetical protein CTRI78_v006568 [Colletotrichum trifolii]
MKTYTALLLVAAATRVAAGGFASSCSDISFSSTTLSANCDDNYQESFSADIDLTKCLANVGGKIVCRPSNPSFKFCDCGLSGDKKSLNCRCTDSSGKKQPTSTVNLDACITNNDAELTCH